MYLDCFSCKINYDVIGARGKIPIVFLHGWGGDTRGFVYFANILSSSFPCILLDFPPFGHSSSPKYPWDIDMYSEVVERIVLNCGFDRCYIVGHSFGGRVAINICKRKKIIVEKMVLTASAGIKNHKLSKKIRVFHFKFLKFLSKIHLYKREKLAKFGSPDYNKLSSVMRQTFKNIVNFDQTNDLKYINCPLLLFWGEKDKDTPFYYTKLFKKYVRECQIVKCPGDHFAYIQYFTLFLMCLKSFL